MIRPCEVVADAAQLIELKGPLRGRSPTGS
jgi:hypothetical protein